MRNQVLNKITKQRSTIQNSLDCMMAHILDLFISGLAHKLGQSITVEVFHSVSATDGLLVNRESKLLLKFVYLGKFIGKFLFNPYDNETSLFDYSCFTIAQLSYQVRLNDSLHPRYYVK